MKRRGYPERGQKVLKNFPHQFNDLTKLHRALQVIAGMIDHGIDVTSDSALGEGLARAGVYAFRDKTLDIEEALRQERDKQKSNRGSETAARDIRRFFDLVDFIERDGSPAGFQLSVAGVALLAAPDANAAIEVWRGAMRALALPDGHGSVSHPYHAMLWLVGQFPGIETSKLMLALEPADDSEAEYRRIAALARLPADEIRRAVGATESHARNAVKILPAIGRQLGDVVSSGGRSFPAPVSVTSEDGTIIVPPERPFPDPALPEQTPVSADDIAPIPDFREVGNAMFDLRGGITLRQQRTLEHQQAVRGLARLLADSGFELFENPYDCLAIEEGRSSILFEVKTLNGELTDERQQAGRALGQLKGYRFFHMPADLANRPCLNVAAFTRQPGPQTVDFLWSAQILVIWLANGEWVFQEPDTRAVLRFNPHAVLARY